jgi:hypothetical protein
LQNPADEPAEEFKQQFLAKLNESLRSEGFSEVQIARIDTVVRRALNLD